MSSGGSEIAALLAVGLVAGTAGGLVGLGGSIVMIPAVTILLDRNQHLAQAAAMIVNVFIAVPSAIRHKLAGRVQDRVVLFMLPAALATILLGVRISNELDGEVLKKIFGAFLLYVMLMKLLKMYKDRGQPRRRDPRLGWIPSSAAGAGMGFSAGLLGIGGGPIAVPLLQRLCRLPLRQSIAASAAAMCVTSVVGAAYKNATLPHLASPSGEALGLHLSDSLIMAACIAPTAVIGAIYGAGLTHRLPLFWVRLTFVFLMGAASFAMLGWI